MMSNQQERDYIDFQRYWQILKRRSLATTVVVGSVFGLTGYLSFSQKPIYEAQGKLLLKQSDASSLTGLNQKVGQLDGLTNTSNPLETEAEIIRSTPIVQKIIETLNLKDRQGKPLKVNAFLGNLQVKAVRGTDVMELSYRSSNPEETTKIVNSLMNVYLENNIRTNRAEATSAREFLSKQLPQVEKKVAEAEKELRQFKDKNKVVSLEEEAKVGVQALKDLSDEITKTEAKLANVNTRSSALQSQLKLTPQQAMVLDNLSQSPGVKQVLSEYQKVQDELAVARTRLTDEHPTVINLKKKEQALRQQLENRVGQIVSDRKSLREQDLYAGQLKQTLTTELIKSEVDTLALANEIRVMQKSYFSYRERLKDLPKLEEQQRSLERKLQVAQTTYQQVLKQLQEIEVAEQQKVGNARVISAALVPDKPISPKMLLNLAVGGFLGILLGVASALMLEAMDKRLKTVDSAKRLLGYPLLGTIPKLNAKNKAQAVLELPTRDNPYSHASTAFEMLITNLSFTLSDKEMRVILVTSSVPGEGKSFIAANLAVAKAQMGRRVLLVDADMRRPRQNQIWELPNFTGLSNLLVGQTELHKAAKEALVGLDVLTSGTIPPNPLALLDSQKMATLIQQASKEYDFVIIDTPPLMLAPEAQILGKLADGMLLVVRPDTVDCDEVTASKNMLKQAGHQVLGMVVNGVAEQKGYYGYYHSQEFNLGKPNPSSDLDEVHIPDIRVG